MRDAKLGGSHGRRWQVVDSLGRGSLVLVVVIGTIPHQLADRRGTTHRHKTLLEIALGMVIAWTLYARVLGSPLLERRARAAVGSEVSFPDQLHDVGCEHNIIAHGAPLNPCCEQQPLVPSVELDVRPLCAVERLRLLNTKRKLYNIRRYNIVPTVVVRFYVFRRNP